MRLGGPSSTAHDRGIAIGFSSACAHVPQWYYFTQYQRRKQNFIRRKACCVAREARGCRVAGGRGEWVTVYNVPTLVKFTSTRFVDLPRRRGPGGGVYVSMDALTSSTFRYRLSIQRQTQAPTHTPQRKTTDGMDGTCDGEHPHARRARTWVLASRNQGRKKRPLPRAP